MAAGGERRQRRAVVVRGSGGRTALVGRAGSGGSKPTSVAVSGALVYVLNNGTPNISGFFSLTELAAIPDSTRPLSSAGADPAQVLFTTDGTVLIVAERGTDTSAVT